MRFLKGITPNEENMNHLNRVIVQDSFHERIASIRKLNLKVFDHPKIIRKSVYTDNISSRCKLLQIEEQLKYTLNPENGLAYSKNVLFGGYDESKAQFLALEGEAQLTTHVLTYISDQEIIPNCKICFYFYSKSSDLEKNNKFVKHTLDIPSTSNVDFLIDREIFLLNSSISNSILFIDGPLIGGNASSYNLKLDHLLNEKSIIPLFIIKNSESNLVVDNTQGLTGKYHSDLHWSYSLLKPGERTAFFRYVDQVNPNNSKIFCYIKPFDHVTTQRIEFSLTTYEKYQSELCCILDLAYYLFLDHGSKTNPQIKPVIFSESYAREILKLINFETLLRNSSLIPIMNETRFGG